MGVPVRGAVTAVVSSSISSRTLMTCSLMNHVGCLFADVAPSAAVAPLVLIVSLVFSGDLLGGGRMDTKGLKDAAR